MIYMQSMVIISRSRRSRLIADRAMDAKQPKEEGGDEEVGEPFGPEEADFVKVGC